MAHFHLNTVCFILLSCYIFCPGYQVIMLSNSMRTNVSSRLRVMNTYRICDFQYSRGSSVISQLQYCITIIERICSNNGKLFRSLEVIDLFRKPIMMMQYYSHIYIVYMFQITVHYLSAQKTPVPCYL